MTQLQGTIQASFAAQGLMTTLGAELIHVSEGTVRIAMRPSPAVSQQHGYTHAGAITSIVDSACGYAALTMAAADQEVLTVEFKTNFMRPAQGQRFVATGEVVKPGRQITVCRGEVIAEHDEQSKTIALMQATMTCVPAANR